ncbi:carbohydrate kinase family protein [Streptobacillus felis]|uniref:Bifunctional hydroxymethylpyrimidine kinase/phosphomethylpyrimidine kinase n=1 Tax=Streptobacillus felis TaxID=1384509 RepID=A0A7Z0PGM3_9FUSO|nr:carbohydrate kinase family protein [Streptobacillus felis]NYV28396.1 bifunctional hydroxymethylpyrimidine kinase/phosphomethylpyrimidine kinase [Streptobacillus felis]
MICIIGGANIDIQGFSYNSIILNDSNPGKIEKGFGGVARNITENLSHLNVKTKFIAPIGDDEFSVSLLEYMKKKNVDMSESLIIPGESLSTYLSVLNDENEMIVAISSMSILEKLKIEFIKEKEKYIKASDLLVIDTNLRQDVIEYISTFDKKIIVDLVSTTKAKKIKNVLNKIHSIKPNKIEAEFLTGIEIVDENSMKLACEKLLSQGIKNIFITLGKDGVFYMNEKKYGLINNPNINAIDITGAGDAFTAGIAYSIEKDYDIEKTAKVALSMSVINVTNLGTCYQNLNEDLLNTTLKKYFNIEL